jgi:hypothetical protein
MTAQETELLTVEQLKELRQTVKTLWRSSVVQPHEKDHLWRIMLRLDESLKTKLEQDGDTQ